MRTFHYAGVATVNVTQGLPRVIEIVDSRKVPKTPTMKVYLEENNSKGKPLRTDEKKVQQIAAALETTTTRDIASIDVAAAHPTWRWAMSTSMDSLSRVVVAS